MQHSPIRKPLGTAIMLVLAGGANGAAAADTSSIAMDAAGNSVVAWQDNSGIDGDLGGIFAQRYNVNGTKASAVAFQVNTTSPGDQRAPASAMAANGAFVIVWQSTDEGGDNGIYAQRYAADGTAAGSEFRVNAITSGAQQNPTVAMNANGDFVIAWEDALGDGSGFGILARAYFANGTAMGNAVAVNSTTAGDQLNPSVAMADNGLFSISWQDANGAIQMQRFDVGGGAVGGEATVAAATAAAISRGFLPAGVATVSGIDVGLSMSGGASGNSVTYTLVAANYGNTASGTVSVVDTLPSNTSFVSASGSGWSCTNNTPANGKVTCDLATGLAAGTYSTLAINVDATGANTTSLTNSATASTTNDVNTANDTTSYTVTTTGSSGGAAGGGAFGWFSLLLGFFGLRRRWQ